MCDRSARSSSSSTKRPVTDAGPGWPRVTSDGSGRATRPSRSTASISELFPASFGPTSAMRSSLRSRLWVSAKRRNCFSRNLMSRTASPRRRGQSHITNGVLTVRLAHARRCCERNGRSPVEVGPSSASHIRPELREPGWLIGRSVDLGGLEPPTSCMPCRRSTRLSYRPVVSRDGTSPPAGRRRGERRMWE